MVIMGKWTRGEKEGFFVHSFFYLLQNKISNLNFYATFDKKKRLIYDFT